MSTSPANPNFWTEEKVSDLLDYLEQINSKLEQQSEFYQRSNDEFEFMQSDEYKAEKQLELDQFKKDAEASLKLEEERHQELLNSMDNVATVAGDETTSTTLVDSFNGFVDTYNKNTVEFNEMLWVVFITALLITAFKQLGDQIWRV